MEIQKYYENEPRFNGVYSRDNWPNKIKDEAYVITLDEYSDIGTHWIPLYVKNNNVTYYILSIFLKNILSIFLKKLKYSLKIKTLKQIFSEYKHMIQ